MKTTKISGTKEWAVKNVNVAVGCSHGCRYCFARRNALRFKKIHNVHEWANPKINNKAVEKEYGKIDGQIMFPSSHDITPKILEPCMIVLGKLLSAGNQVLVVSKPHIECIEEITNRFIDFKNQMLDSSNVIKMFYFLKNSVTHSIWIGKMNQIRNRVEILTEEDEIRVKEIENGQTDERIREIYDALKDEPLIRWKESFKEVLGLKLPTESGLDL
jgi:hypothetical protein